MRRPALLLLSLVVTLAACSEPVFTAHGTVHVTPSLLQTAKGKKLVVQMINEKDGKATVLLVKDLDAEVTSFSKELSCTSGAHHVLAWIDLDGSEGALDEFSAFDRKPGGKDVQGVSPTLGVTATFSGSTGCQVTDTALDITLGT